MFLVHYSSCSSWCLWECSSYIELFFMFSSCSLLKKKNFSMEVTESGSFLQEYKLETLRSPVIQYDWNLLFLCQIVSKSSTLEFIFIPRLSFHKLSGLPLSSLFRTTQFSRLLTFPRSTYMTKHTNISIQCIINLPQHLSIGSKRKHHIGSKGLLENQRSILGPGLFWELYPWE